MPSAEATRKNEYSIRDLPMLLRRYEVGDGVDDIEMRYLLRFYRVTLRNLELLGPHFDLATRAVRNDVMRLEGYERTRKQDGKNYRRGPDDKIHDVSRRPKQGRGADRCKQCERQRDYHYAVQDHDFVEGEETTT